MTLMMTIMVTSKMTLTMLQMILEDLIADQEGHETVPKEMTFLEDLLQSLSDLKRGKIDWSEIYVNDLENKFLKHPKECMKMVVDEINLIDNLIQTYPGIQVFNISDNKKIKINKLMANLQTSSQELISTRRRGWQTKRVKTLKKLTCTPVKVWVSSFLCVNGNGISVLAIMKKMKNGHHFINIDCAEKIQITNAPRPQSLGLHFSKCQQKWNISVGHYEKN